MCSKWAWHDWRKNHVSRASQATWVTHVYVTCTHIFLVLSLSLFSLLISWCGHSAYCCPPITKRACLIVSSCAYSPITWAHHLLFLTLAYAYSHCFCFAFLPLQSLFPATRAGLFQEIRNWAGNVWMWVCVDVFARPCFFSVSLVMSDCILCNWSQCWKTAAATCQLWEGITVIKCFAQSLMTSAQLLNWLHCLHLGDFSSVCNCLFFFPYMAIAFTNLFRTITHWITS